MSTEELDRLDQVEMLQLRLAATEEARCKAELRAAELALQLLHGQIGQRHKIKPGDSIDMDKAVVVRAKATPSKNGAA